MKVRLAFFITGITGNPFSTFNSTDYEIPEIFNFTTAMNPDGFDEMFDSGDAANEWLNDETIQKRMKTREIQRINKRMKNDNLNHPNNDCTFPDIIVHAGDIIDGISVNDELFGNDGGSPYCINLGDDEIVTSLIFGHHTHSYWALAYEKSRRYSGHLCDLKIVTNQNTFGPFGSWHGQCSNLNAVQIQTGLESFLRKNGSISRKGMLLIQT